MEKVRAILLKRTRFSESSMVCVWMSFEQGKVKTAARGALRPGSAFAGCLDLFYEADIAFARSRSGEIHALREVKLRQAFDGAGGRYPNLAVASYFASLVDLVTEPLGHSSEVFDLLRRAVGYLRSEHPSARAIPHFETELCRALGILDPQERADPLRLLSAQSSRLPAGRDRALRACAPLAPAPSGDKMP